MGRLQWLGDSGPLGWLGAVMILVGAGLGSLWMKRPSSRPFTSTAIVSVFSAVALTLIATDMNISARSNMWIVLFVGVWFIATLAWHVHARRVSNEPRT